jgi:hypothetical protein
VARDRKISIMPYVNNIVKNVALNPVAYKEIDPIESFIPTAIDLRNGYISDTGNFVKRNGYTEKWDTGEAVPVETLIPKNVGYAITANNKVFRLDTLNQLTGVPNGSYRTQWEAFDDRIILCDGGTPVYIQDNKVYDLEGSPKRAKFISTVSGYILLSGYNDTEVQYNLIGNPEVWTGFFNIKKDGQSIKYHTNIKERTYIFKEEVIEVWTFIGGSTPFVTQNQLWINKGLGATYSVVKVDDTLFWYGDDGDFHTLAGAGSQVISESYRAELDKLNQPDQIYGFHCRKESCIRWIAPSDGKCFTYYYKKGYFIEDNVWLNGKFERLPFNSYMEFNGKQYFGDYNNTGLVYEWDKSYKDDNGEPIRVYRNFTVRPFNNTARFNKLEFRLKRGLDNNSTEFFYRYRLDKGTWSNFEYVSMGNLGDYDPYIERHNLGIGKEIEFEVVETDAVDFIMTDMNLTIASMSR